MMWAVVFAIVLALLGLGLWLFAGARAKSEAEQFTARVGVIDIEKPAPEQDSAEPATVSLVPLAWFLRLTRSAGFEMTPRKLYVYLGLLVVTGIGLTVVFGLLGPTLILGFVILCILVLLQRKRKRRRHINQQMPQFLGYVMRSMTAGNTMEEAIQAAVRESEEPIRGVFSGISRQVALGADIEDMLYDAADVYQLRTLHILAMSARVNRRFGGSMRRVIATLIDTIQQREEASRELKALTGETRFSAYVVAAIPILISLFFYFQNPDYYIDMLASRGGRIAIAMALALEAFGLFIIWRMMSRLGEPTA